MQRQRGNHVFCYSLHQDSQYNQQLRALAINITESCLLIYGTDGQHTETRARQQHKCERIIMENTLNKLKRKNNSSSKAVVWPHMDFCLPGLLLCIINLVVFHRSPKEENINSVSNSVTSGECFQHNNNNSNITLMETCARVDSDNSNDLFHIRFSLFLSIPFAYQHEFLSSNENRAFAILFIF